MLICAFLHKQQFLSTGRDFLLPPWEAGGTTRCPGLLLRSERSPTAPEPCSWGGIHPSPGAAESWGGEWGAQGAGGNPGCSAPSDWTRPVLAHPSPGRGLGPPGGMRCPPPSPPAMGVPPHLQHLRRFTPQQRPGGSGREPCPLQLPGSAQARTRGARQNDGHLGNARSIHPPPPQAAEQSMTNAPRVWSWRGLRLQPLPAQDQRCGAASADTRPPGAGSPPL